MPRSPTVLTFVLLVGCALVGPIAEAHGNPHVLLVTERGEIEIELFPDRAPVTVANFLRYIDEGTFEPKEGKGGATFYRVVRPDNQPGHPFPIAVVQGGFTIEDYDPRRLPPIRHETTEETGLRHRDGAVSMARNEPGTASSEIFICVGDQPELDFGGRRNPDRQGFAVFGQVVRGMEVVRVIHQLPDDDQMLRKPVRILEVRRIGVPPENPDQGP